MEFETFERKILQNWTESLGCPLESALQPGTHLIPKERLDGKGLLRLIRAGQHTWLEFDPQLADIVEQAGASLRAEDLAGLPGVTVTNRECCLFHYLYPPDLPACQPATPYTLRQLTMDDAGRMQVLHDANPPEEVEAGYVEVDHPVAFGCLADDQLAAAASGFESRGFMDIGVLTMPAYRRLGLGRAAVGALCAWSIERGYLPQYRCDARNLASARLALSLGFRLYVTEEEITLKR
jgi:GNAT superfamily N-acetyltransferase